MMCRFQDWELEQDVNGTYESRLIETCLREQHSTPCMLVWSWAKINVLYVA